MSTGISLTLAFLAYSLLSTGLVLMKKGIAWIGFKGPKDKEFLQPLFIWIAGFFLINLYIAPTTMALKTLEPHIVSAVAGWGVVVLIGLAYLILGEKLFCSDFLFTVVIVSAIVLLNVFEAPGTEDHVSLPALITAGIFPLGLLASALWKGTRRKIRSLLFAAVSGISTGMIIVMMKVLVSWHGLQVRSYFSSPYLYAYLVFSLLAFITLQAAYKSAGLMRVGPVQYSLAIVYPVICSLWVFENRIQPLQLAAVAAVMLGVAGILRRR